MIFADCPDVRFAELGDERPLFELMKLAHAESGEHPLSVPKVATMIANGIAKQASIIGTIGTVGEPLRGYLIMCFSPIWYSDDYQLLELSNFVHPEHRRSNYAKQLIGFAKQCSKSLELYLTIGVFSSERTEAKVRLYKRQLTERGAFFGFDPASCGLEVKR